MKFKQILSKLTEGKKDFKITMKYDSKKDEYFIKVPYSSEIKFFKSRNAALKFKEEYEKQHNLSLEGLKESMSPIKKKIISDNPRSEKYDYAILDSKNNVIEFSATYNAAYDRAKNLEKKRKEKLNIFNIQNDEISDF